ncbi:PLD nuclease N-terminal domain-containing protein [Pseudomonas palleroniana]|uniref:PLD nuclease N-terminal domain-containing protein n=1 Tax=Pseudomonas palleroniana TaxID=191390 RepID=UPI003AFFC17B
MQTTYFWIGLAVVLILLDLWIINSVWRSDDPSGRKAGWTAIVVLLPFLGASIWAIAGPRGVTKGPSSPEHSKG